MSVTLRDFQPINTWIPHVDGPSWSGSDEPMYIIDESTGREYLNESDNCLRLKCFLLCFKTPVSQGIALPVNVAWRIAKLGSFSHFWVDLPVNGGCASLILGDGNTKYRFKKRLGKAGEDVLRIAATPISYVGLELATIYGVVNPNDGRKLYASIERAIYGGDYFDAPCFQPEPQYHAFGGDISQKDAF